jgi:RNA polymerase sigma factor (sigma-70 family)
MADAPLGMVLRRLRGLIDTHTAGAASDGQLLERFTARREEAAFAALLHRHGPMVLGLCRRVARHAQAAEDAFQATFLLLARKAGSIRKGESVGGWLYRVAFRLAVKARAQAARRREREHRVADMRKPELGFQAAWQDLQEVLDEELERLPEKYRAPLVLCYLQGKTQEEAMRQLGCPLGTVRSRLARARKLLRARLARRGLTLGAAALGTALAANSATAALPGTLLNSTLKAGLHFAAGGAVGPGVSARTAALVKGGLQAMATEKVRFGIVVFLALGLVAAGAGLVAHRALATGPGKEPGPMQEAPRSGSFQRGGGQPPRISKTPAKGDAARQMTLTGRVLGPDGKPVAGAEVGAVAYTKRQPRKGEGWQDVEEVLGVGKTDRRGRFRLSVRRTSSAEDYSLHVIAAGRGYGLGWHNLHPDVERPEADIRLRPEQTLRGRLLDVQGNPAAGIKVHLAYVGDDKKHDTVGFYKAHKGLPAWPAPVTTDPQGRFAFPGLGRNLIAGLRVTDDRFARQELHSLATGEGKLAKEVTRLLAPPQAVEGRVTFADTGKPVANARLEVRGYNRKFNAPTFENGQVTAWTDPRGRYRVNGYPGNTVHISVFPPAGSAYLPAAREITWPKETVKQRVNVALPRGVLVRGRVTELPSGKPVARVHVEYWPQRGNLPFVRPEAVSGADGSFQVTVPPRPGKLFFQSSVPDFIQEVAYRYIASGEITRRPPDKAKMRANSPQPDQALYLHALHDLDLKEGTKSVAVKVALRRGVTVRGSLLGPGGKPVAQAEMLCRLSANSFGFITLGPVELCDGRFTLRGCDPDKTYPVLFLDARNRWGAAVRIPAKQASKKPPTVRLAPCGSAALRLLDFQGQPFKNHQPNLLRLEVLLPPAAPADPKASRTALPPTETVWLGVLDSLHYNKNLKADGKGRITLPALIPGATYRVQGRDGVREFKAESGKAVQLGDVSFD